MKDEQLSTEQLIEELKKQYSTVKFRAGSVGFAIFYGHACIPFSYRLFQQQDWPVVLDCAITILEVTHAGAHSPEQFD